MKKLTIQYILLFCLSILIIFSIFFFTGHSYSYYESNISFKVISSKIQKDNINNVTSTDN